MLGVTPAAGDISIALTFELLVLCDHPLEDHSDDLPHSGCRCVVGDVVLSEMEAETQDDGLERR